MHPSLLQAAASELAPDGQDNSSEETIRRIFADFSYLHCSLRVNSAYNYYGNAVEKRPIIQIQDKFIKQKDPKSWSNQRQ